MKRLLVIAGTDSSGGAGLARDIATATGHGCAVTPVVTAVTAQSDAAIRAIHPIPATTVRLQIETALEQAPPDAIKIGMLGTPDIAATVALALRNSDIPVVLDPVLKSSSGGTLSRTTGIAPLLALARLVTPNLPEAAALTHTSPAVEAAGIARQAKILRDMGATAVLVKGGHGDGPECTDHLFGPSGHFPFTSRRLARGRRGTGCTLSTAIACNLAWGHDMPAACQRAKTHVHRWLAEPGQAVSPSAI